MPTLILLSAVVLQAGPGAVSLAEAEQALIEGRFEAVLERSTSALAEGLPPDAQVRALELLGIAEAAFGREEEAVIAFRRILWRVPEHALPPQSSPKLLALFSEAQAAGPLAPTPEPSGRFPTGPPEYVRWALSQEKSAQGTGVSEASGSHRWWIWAALGGVGLGAGIAAWQLTRPELPRGSLGREHLR